jgi:hypothetical protein
MIRLPIFQFLRKCGCRARVPQALVLVILAHGAMHQSLRAQAVSVPQTNVSDDAQQLTDIEKRLDTLTESLSETQQALRASLLEIQLLHAELDALRAKKTTLNPDPSLGNVPLAGPHSLPQPTGSTDQEQIQALQEQQDIQQAEIKQHEQTKVETDSKYALHVTGLLLFNAFSNAGVVDDPDLPSYAFPRNPGSSHGSLGGDLRQTILGLAATGPVVLRAQTSAIINVDFFGGVASNAYGYTAASGYVRLRNTQLGLDWKTTTLQLGYTGPLISPLSPTSYATVAQPAFTASGNLWTWSPQLRVEQRIPLFSHSGLHLEAGLIDPSSPNYYSAQLVSPVEASRRPGAEGRISFHADSGPTASLRSLVIGVGAYTANQAYAGYPNVHSWAVTGDWQIPLTRGIDFSGEIYRGRALGGLGGGVYKDTLTGTDPLTGLSRTIGVDTAGGWTQLKLTANSRLEANAVFGLDDAFASNFEQVTVPVNAVWPTTVARNSSVMGNLVYRPMSSFILSPEYRRILTWNYYGTSPYVANIFTISAGYRF